MKKPLLIKSLLLLCAIMVGNVAWADDYELYSGTITEGDYVIVYDGGAMKNTISSNRLQYDAVTISDDKISNPASSLVWHIAASGDYWTIYNAAVSKYAASTGSNNQAKLEESVTNNSKWTVTGTSTYEFENLARANANNKWLRRNSTYGFACYATGTGGALSLYKKVEAAGAITTVTINSTGITNTNKFIGTAAGTLTASVTYGSPTAAVPESSVTWSSSDENVATVDETTGVVTLVGEGSTTITATYAGKVGEYKSSSAEYVLNVTNENPDAITVWSEDFSDYKADDVPSGGTYSYTCDNGGGTTKIYEEAMAEGTSPELLVAKSGGYFQVVVPIENIEGDMKLKFKKYSNSLTVSTSTEGVSISGTSTFADAGECTVTFTGITTNMTSLTIKFTTGSSKNVRIDDIVLKGTQVEVTKVVTITTADYATFVSTEKTDFAGTGITAYTAKVNGNSVTLTSIEKVPANTPVVVHKDVEETTIFNVPVTTADIAAVSENDLCVSDGTNAVGTNVYVLGNTDGIGFYKWTSNNSLSAGKVYLNVRAMNAPAGSRDYLTFAFEDQATGVGASLMNSEKCKVNSAIFDLQGRRVVNPTKGLYIVNGKKVIVK